MTTNPPPPLPVRYIAALLDGSFDAVILREPDGTILSWNPAAQRIYGYTAGEAIGTTMDMVVPEAHWDDYQEHKQRVRRGEVIPPFETVLRRKDGSLFDVLVTLIPVRDEQGGVAAVWSMSQDITERKRAQEHQAMLIAELDHRVKNFLATVQALVRQTLTASPEAEALTGRIRALVIAHELLAKGQWRGTSMHPLMTSVLQPYQTDPRGERIRMQGPDVRLGSRPAQTLMLGLNELATNALKYGALSVPSGYVDVRWHVTETPPTLSLTWQERNGPAVASPQRRGFGSRLIEGSLAMESGSARLSFEPDGLHCSITLPLGVTTAEAPAAAEPQAPVAEYSGPVILRGKRVLVVEDEPLLAGLMEDILAGAGCGVVGPLSRLDSAVTTALREPVDAAILDVNLNGELVTPLAELLSQRNVPFVFVTGYGRLDALPQHLRRTTIVHKPVQELQILAALAKAVQEQVPPRPRPL